MNTTLTSVVRVGSIALLGITGTRVLVEAAVSQQLPGLTIIGLPDAALGEAKQRVRLSVQQSGLTLCQRMIVINLSPAALPKHGASFDLAIALSAVAASGGVVPSQLQDIAHLGELSLDGTLRRPHGLFTLVLAAKALGFHTVMVPEAAQDEARLVPGINVIGVPSLRAAIEWHGLLVTPRSQARSLTQVSTRLLTKNSGGAAPGIAGVEAQPLVEREIAASHSVSLPDISDVVGQEDAVEAVLVAAAGRHHMSLTGPPGAGKSMLAERLRTILPPLTDSESLRATSIAALGNEALHELIRSAPFEQPHHTASLVSIIGGVDGSQIRPGAITRASWGVLFLDEAPEFPRGILDSLRQPLESGTITLTRARVQAVLPTTFQLVLASNPCPCGWDIAAQGEIACRCTPHSRIRYSQRVSAPLRDRIDVHCQLRRVKQLRTPERSSQRPPGVSQSKKYQSRVTAARACMAERLAHTPWCVNAEVSGRALRESELRISRTETHVIDRALEQGRITLRGYDRCLRLAWTISDLAGTPSPRRAAIAQALTMRGVQS